MRKKLDKLHPLKSEPRPPSIEILCPNRGKDLDEEYLVQNFLGKTRCQVVKMLSIDPLRSHFFINDFSFMSNYGFSYYFPAVISYLDLLREKNELEFFEIAFSDILRALLVRGCDPSSLRDPLIRSQVSEFLERYSSVLMTTSDDDFCDESTRAMITDLLNKLDVTGASSDRGQSLDFKI
jgi:hypothetical protein